MKTARRTLLITGLALGLAGAGFGLAGNVAHADDLTASVPTLATTTDYTGVNQWELSTPVASSTSSTDTSTDTMLSTLTWDGSVPINLESFPAGSSITYGDANLTLAPSDATTIAP